MNPETNEALEQATPQEILHWAAETYGEQLTIVTSFQPSGLVMLHMMRDIMPDITVLTLDTELLFPETDALISQWEREYGLNLIRVRAAQTLEEQAAMYGEALWQRDPNLCCHLRKTLPLGEALRPYKAWITGVRRDQSERRRSTPIIAWDAKYNCVKLAPMAAWTEAMVWDYIYTYGLPYNPLHDQGYASIGCRTCTRAIAAGEDKRAGRWSGHGKTECGIHLEHSGLTKV